MGQSHERRSPSVNLPSKAAQPGRGNDFKTPTKSCLICESKPSETKIIHLQQFHWASHVPASFAPKSWITHVPTSFVPKSGLSLTHIPVSFAPKSCITHVSAGFAPKKRTVLRILLPTTCQIKVVLRFIMRA